MYRCLTILASILLTAGCTSSRLSIKPAEVHNPDSVTKSTASRMLNTMQGTWTCKLKKDKREVEIKNDQWSEKWGDNLANGPEVFELELSYAWTAGDTITMRPGIMIESRSYYNQFSIVKVARNKFVLMHFDERRVYRREK